MEKILLISNLPNYFYVTIGNKLKEEYDIMLNTAFATLVLLAVTQSQKTEKAFTKNCQKKSNLMKIQ